MKHKKLIRMLNLLKIQLNNSHFLFRDKFELNVVRMFNNCITLVHVPGCYISWAWLSIADIGHLSPLGRRLLTARQSPEPESDQPRPPRATQLMLWYTTCRNLIKITNIPFVMVLPEQVFCVSKYFQFDVNLEWN